MVGAASTDPPAHYRFRRFFGGLGNDTLNTLRVKAPIRSGRTTPHADGLVLKAAKRPVRASTIVFDTFLEIYG